MSNVFCVFDVPEFGYRSRGMNCLNQSLLIEFSVTFPIGCVATLTKHSLEGRPVKQQPTFDMRIENGRDHGRGSISADGLPRTLVQSFAIGVGGDDNQDKPRSTLLLLIRHVVVKFRADFAWSQALDWPNNSDQPQTAKLLVSCGDGLYGILHVVARFS